MTDRTPSALRTLVQRRAGHRCEYCLLHEEDADLLHEIDHIIATKHRGETREENLAWACFSCNRHKGTDLASIDPETGLLVRLFRPRQDRWQDHFRLEGSRIQPMTPEGRVTEFLLQFNDVERSDIRALSIRQGRYPR